MKLKSTGLKFKNLGNPPTTIQTPDNHISLPTQVLAVGSVGRGPVVPRDSQNYSFKAKTLASRKKRACPGKTNF